MYYPYLRAKQYELKALREFSSECSPEAVSCITPILEPVKRQTNALDAAVLELMHNEMRFALVLNPSDGDYKHSTVKFDYWKHSTNLMGNQDKWIPAFLCSRSNLSSVASIIEAEGLHRVMLIFRTCLDAENSETWEVINNSSVEYVVNAFGSTVSRRMKSRLNETEKKIIRLDDCFNSKNRDADYAMEDDELFSEEPFYYRSEEGFWGYSDYTVLPSVYVEGGMLPYALAIHLTYRKNEDQLYIHHFVSDNNKTKSDVRGKFREAAIKVEPFFMNLTMTPSVVELIRRADDSEGYPGLGYLKKLSVKNHLELIASI